MLLNREDSEEVCGILTRKEDTLLKPDKFWSRGFFFGFGQWRGFFSSSELALLCKISFNNEITV